MRVTRLCLALAAAPLVPLALASPAAAADADCEQIRAEDPVDRSADGPSAPSVALGVPRAQALAAVGTMAPAGAAAGAGVRVAVVDSGVASTDAIRVVERVAFTRTAEILDPHGTAVAGLVAARSQGAGGSVGVAPGADVVDVRFYDERVPTQEGSLAPDARRLAAGLTWVAGHAAALRIGVVVVATPVEADPALQRAVERLGRRDVVVVAAAGDRPVSPADPFYAQFGERRPGEDAAGWVFPAGYDSVLAVSATADGAPGVDARDSVLPSSAIDLVAPTYGALSVALNGGVCGLPGVSTSWSAAEVAGVVALLRAHLTDDNARQVVARLLVTATGSAAVSTPLTGAGVVSPVEALTRPLRPDRAGSIAVSAPERDRFPRATAPESPEDRSGTLRRTTLWWGLLGGAAVVLALLLRPLVARRR